MQQDAAQKNKKAAVPLQLIIDYVEASGSAAGMLQRMGEQKAAHDNFLLAVRHLEPIIGQLPPQQAPPLLMRYADALVGLADTLEHLGKPAESRACAERALGVLKNLVPPQHPLVTTCIQILQRLQVRSTAVCKGGQNETLTAAQHCLCFKVLQAHQGRPGGAGGSARGTPTASPAKPTVAPSPGKAPAGPTSPRAADGGASPAKKAVEGTPNGADGNENAGAANN